ncbi:MAG: zf-HC2 domain-containing protein [Lachnospiraceae bacterium]|nr:zf-HC2 domain-containing protein [Lachnospiraceae bacterium]MCM1241148.1 zf-HC2 domain-containing protein [Lachnospiraceae bacterium]
MKMKCSVIQDLLPSYVDDICSEDTGELVREHVAECEQCREKLEQMKNTEIVADKASKKQVDHLKKIRNIFARKEGVGKLLLLLLVGIAYAGLFVGGGGLLNYAWIPSLAVSAVFFCAAILAGNYRFSGGKARVAEIAVSGVIFVFVVAYYAHFTLALGGMSQNADGEWLMQIFPLGMMRPYQIGPFMANLLRIMALISVAALLWNTFGKYKNAYATTLNITTIVYIVYANDGLYHMDAPDTFAQWVNELTIVQVALAVAGTAVCVLLQKFGKMPAGKSFDGKK